MDPIGSGALGFLGGALGSLIAGSQRQKKKDEAQAIYKSWMPKDGRVTAQAYADLMTRLNDNEYAEPYLNAARTLYAGSIDAEQKADALDKESRNRRYNIRMADLRERLRDNDIAPGMAGAVYGALENDQDIPDTITRKIYREQPVQGQNQIDATGRMMPLPTETVEDSESVPTFQKQEVKWSAPRQAYDQTTGQLLPYWIQTDQYGNIRQVEAPQGAALARPQKSKGGGRGGPKPMTSAQQQAYLESKAQLETARAERQAAERSLMREQLSGTAVRDNSSRLNELRTAVDKARSIEQGRANDYNAKRSVWGEQMGEPAPQTGGQPAQPRRGFKR